MTMILRVLCVLFLLSGSAFARSSSESEPQPADRIVAVVNDEVITYHELQSKLDQAIGQLRKQGTSLPPRDVLERQMLERMIMDKVQLQYARESGIRVDDAQLEQGLQRIAAGNKMTPEQFRATLKKDGIDFAKFREEIRDEMTIARVREREVDNRIVISEGEIDNYLSADSAKGGAGEEYDVAHILFRAPESASPEQLQSLKAKAEQVLDRLRKGEDFAQLAASYSDAPDGLKGGSLGLRPLNRLPAIFADAVVKLKVGQVSPLLRSSNGFHIIKLVSKNGGTLPPVQQTHVRHILIRVNEVVSEADARHKLEGLYDRIIHGEKFEDLARLYSQDGSASKGGDLGWIYPSDTVPEFEQAMNQLKPGELSKPVHSPFGYHLIQVLERRVQDVSADRQRAAAREVLRGRKMDEAYQDWLRQARDRAYIDIRLEDQ